MWSLNPQFVPYLLQPSTVLLCAGLRAVSPYVILDDETRKRESLLARVVSRHGLNLIAEESGEDSQSVFQFISTERLKEIPASYRAIAQTFPPPSHRLTNGAALYEWIEHFRYRIAALCRREVLPSIWIESDSWAPHNLAFGMMLGYPGPAIASVCWDEVPRVHPQLALDEVIIAPSGWNCCFGAQVSYVCESRLMLKPVITCHSKLWEAVLQQVRDTFPIDRMLRNVAFARTFHALAEKDGFRGIDQGLPEPAAA